MNSAVFCSSFLKVFAFKKVVLVSADIELIFQILSGMMLCFGFGKNRVDSMPMFWLFLSSAV